MYKKLQINIFIIFISSFLSAQEKDGKHLFNIDGFETSYNDGVVMPHNETIDFLTRDYIRSFSLNFLYHTNGEKLWQKLYHNPQLGWGYSYSTLGNKKIFGDAHSIYSFFEAPVLSIHDKAQINYRLAFGLSYVTKTFDLKNNYSNIAIGSNINMYFNLMLNAAIKLTNDYHIFGATGLTHFSNGKVKAPNKGINTITTSAGLRYYFNHNTYRKKPEIEIPEIERKGKFSIIWSHGTTKYNRLIDKPFYISSLNASYERKYKHWAQYGFGLDAFYNGSLKIQIENYPDENFNKDALYRLGAHLSHDFLVGDVALTIQLGHYIYNKRFFITDFYNRVGLKYYFSDHWLLNVSLKSHYANAEFIEFGIGYYL
ncbi:MAG: acyloxyacyl hydrolase [Bacteroidales bacterium]